MEEEAFKVLSEIPYGKIIIKATIAKSHSFFFKFFNNLIGVEKQAF